jgi:hypothetical protein
MSEEHSQSAYAGRRTLVRCTGVPAKSPSLGWRGCILPVEYQVIVATGYGYRRKDGMAVIPISALGP